MADRCARAAAGSPTAHRCSSAQRQGRPGISTLAHRLQTNVARTGLGRGPQDGISEEIIRCLSKLRWLFVIARNSSFTYKGKAVDVKRAIAALAHATLQHIAHTQFA